MVARRPGGQLRRAGWSRAPQPLVAAGPGGAPRPGPPRRLAGRVYVGTPGAAYARAGVCRSGWGPQSWPEAGARGGVAAGAQEAGGHDCWGGQEAGPTSHCSGLGARKCAAARASSGAAASSSAGTAASRSVTGSSSRGAAAMRPTRPPCCRPSRCLAARRTAGSTRRPGSCGPTCAGTSCCGLVPRAHGAAVLRPAPGAAGLTRTWDMGHGAAGCGSNTKGCSSQRRPNLRSDARQADAREQPEACSRTELLCPVGGHARHGGRRGGGRRWGHHCRRW